MTSCPTLRAAKRYGISGDHAYLISDLVAGICGQSRAWPPAHPWHLWALNKAQQDVGPPAVISFVAALTLHHRGRSGTP